jgi:hypothetical protein
MRSHIATLSRSRKIIIGQGRECHPGLKIAGRRFKREKGRLLHRP